MAGVWLCKSVLQAEGGVSEGQWGDPYRRGTVSMHPRGWAHERCAVRLAKAILDCRQFIPLGDKLDEDERLARQELQPTYKEDV